jgi:hypothetical protein
MLRKKVRGPKNKNKRGSFGGVFLAYFFLLVVIRDSGVRGGGKCPEEEHTTCSGGPTILVTSAVYGEREKRVKIINIILRKNKIKYKIFSKNIIEKR